MKKTFFVLMGMIILFPLTTVSAQKLIKNSAITGKCYAGHKPNRYYVPPPKEFYERLGSKRGGTITVNYSGFTTQAKAAMNYAISVLQTLLPADTKFTINATWKKISTSGVLAQSSITGYIGGWAIDALDPKSFYPVALAEKISGKSLNNDSDADVTLEVNSSINWYLGTDGATPTSKYDLVTVALHEICHGLGFYDSFNVDGSLGYWGSGSVPLIYDKFVENYNGQKLIDTTLFVNGSAALKTQLTGSNIFFNGPLLFRYTNGLRAKLYAPSTWDSGSSVSHLDETATLPVNSLMTPYINPGEAIHDPGKYTFSILGDLGWINTRIIHSSMGDTENHLSQVTLSAVVRSDTAYNHNRVGVVYSFDNFITSDSLYLGSTGVNDTYETAIPIPSYNSQLKYYLFVTDCFSRLYRSPSLYTDNRYSVYIGTDTVKPVITHTPAGYYLQTVDTLKFNATITDNLGIDSAYIEYRVNNGALSYLRMNSSNAGSYSAVINAKLLSLKGDDTLQYRIFALDTARVPNLAVLPRSGFFKIPVEGISSVVTRYSTDFSNSSSDFFNSGFEIIKPSGFKNFGLNSKHPYESPEDNSKSINYISILRHPIKLDESGMEFSYNEIALVEPGESGSVYTSSDFYDYVIVEGSKDYGKSWFALTDGYDCRYFPDWETAYKSSISGYNSTYIPTEDLLRKHQFLYKPDKNISAGDTLLVRFRLYSDPFSNGWGWVIENLKISPLVDAVEKVQTDKIVIYPNPGKGIINMNNIDTGNENYKTYRFYIYNSTGACIVSSTLSPYSAILADISKYPAGLYFIVVYHDNDVLTMKYNLVK